MLEEEYQQYLIECHNKHEDAKPKNIWLKERFADKPYCKKCQIARSVLIRKGVRIK
jgi:hypothetical protein